MSILKTLKKILGATPIGAWAKSALNKALTSAADKVAAKYGDKAIELVRDAAVLDVSSPEKLFKVATDLVALIAADGVKAPFGVAVIVAQQAYEQVKGAALDDLKALTRAL